MGKIGKDFSKALALLLAAAMVFTGVPATAFANELIVDAGVESDTLISDDDVLVEEDSVDAVIDDSTIISDDESIDSDDISDIDSVDLFATEEDVTNEGKEDDDVSDTEEVDPDKAATFRVLEIYKAGTGTEEADKIIEDIELNYGVGFTDKGVARAVDTYPATDVDPYTGTSWTLYTLKVGVEDEEAYAEAAANYTAAVTAYESVMANNESTNEEKSAATKAVTDLIAAAELPAGVEADNVNGVYTLSGTPTQVINTKYLLMASDNNNTDGVVKRYSNLFGFVVEQATIGIDENAGLDTGDDESGKGFDIAETVKVDRNTTLNEKAEKVGTIAFPATAMNYDIAATAPSDGTPYVAPVKIKLNTTVEGDIEDLECVIRNTTTGAVSTDFEVSPIKEGTDTINGRLSSTGKVELTINPAKGLAAGEYSAYLCISSETALSNVKVIKLTFEVENDISLGVKISGYVQNFDDVDASEPGMNRNFVVGETVEAEGTIPAGVYVIKDDKFVLVTEEAVAEENTVTYVKTGTEEHPYPLGMIEVGMPVDDIEFIAFGGTTGLKIDVASAGDATALSNAGLVVVPGSSAEKSATATLGGAIKQGATTPVTFALVASDDDDNYDKMWFKLEKFYAPLEVSIGTDKFTYGEDEDINAYSWKVASNVEYTNAGIEVTISNPTSYELTVEGAFEPASTGLSITSPENKDEKYTIKVPKKSGDANGTASFAIRPSAVNATGNFVISGEDIEDTKIGLDFTKLEAGEIAITAPSNEVLDTAYVGRSYEYQLEATYSSGIEEPTWSVAEPVVAAGTGELADKFVIIDKATKKVIADNEGHGYNDEEAAGTAITGLGLVSATDLNKTYGITLSQAGLFKSTNSVTFNDANGKLKGADELDNIRVMVLVKYYEGTATDATYLTEVFTLPLDKPKEPLDVTSGSTVLTYDKTGPKVLDMGTVGVGSDGVSAAINLANNSAVDLKNVSAVVDKVYTVDKYGKETKVAEGGTGYFSIIFSDNATVQADAEENGVTVEGNGTNSFNIKSVEGGNLEAGKTYKAYIKIAPKNEQSFLGVINPDMGSQIFAVTLKVEKTPVITAVGFDEVGNALTSENLNTGKTLKATDGLGFSAVIEGEDTQFDLSWAPLDAGKTTLNGLTLTEDGDITGKPDKAGKFDIVVTATSRTDGTKITGTKQFTLVVAGAADMSLKAADLAGTDTEISEGDTWIMPTLYTGSEDPSEQQIKISVAEEAAKNLHINISEAEDDRTAAEIAKSKANPYAANNSVSYFEVSKSEIASAPTTKVTTFDIASKGSPAAGKYKAKITITGDNVSTVSFYVYLIVMDKLSVADKNGQAQVGVPYYFGVSAAGGYGTQVVTWNEAKSKTDGDAPDQTKIPEGLGLIQSNYNGQIVPTQAVEGTDDYVSSLYAAIGDLNGADASEGTFDVTDAESLKGVPEKSGTAYKFYLKASALALSVTEETEKTIATYKNGADAIPAQEAIGEFDIVIDKSDKVVFKELSTLGADGGTINNSTIIGDNVKKDLTDEKYYDKGIVGKEMGNVYEYYTGYVFKPQTTGYTPGQVQLTLENYSDVEMTLSPAFSGGTKTNFEITDGLTGGKIVVPAATDATTPGSVIITIKPYDDLTVSEKAYEEILTITGDELKDPLTFTLSFTVEAASYITDVEYLPYNAETAEDFVKVVSENSIYDNNKVILKPQTSIAAGVTDREAKVEAAVEDSKNELIIGNVGNSSISSLTATEVSATGGTLASDAHMLGTLALKTKDGEGHASDYNDEAITPDNYVYLTVAPADTFATPGEKNGYIKLQFKDGTNKNVSYIIPVSYIVYADGLDEKVTVTPADRTFDLGEIEEGYAEADNATNITIANGNNEGVANALDTVTIVAEDGLVLSAANGKLNANNTTLKYASLAAGSSEQFTVAPKKGLPQGDYECSVVITANNLTTPVRKTFKFTVTASESFSADVYSWNDANIIGGDVEDIATVDKGFAVRLYNTLYGLSAKNDAYFKGYADAEGHETDPMPKTYAAGVVMLDLDKNGDGDTEVLFKGSAAVPGDVQINRGDGLIEMALEKVAVTLTNDEISAITKDDTSTSKTGYFKTMNFNNFHWVGFAVDPDNGVEFTESILELKDAENVKFFNVDDDETEITGNTKASEIYKLAIRVPAGKTLGSVFDGGVLPEAKKAGVAFSNWFNDGVNVKATTVIKCTNSLTPVWHSHSYPASTEGDSEYVKWTWVGSDAEGYTDASVVIYCIENCPDSDKGKLEFTTKSDPAISLSKNDKVVADCIHGASTEYTAELIYGGNTYTSKKLVENGEPLGHKYVPTITWTSTDTVDEKTGKTVKVWKPSVVLNCSVCSIDTEGHTYEVPEADITYTVDKETKPATCTTAGEVTYTLVSYKDAAGKTVTEFAEGTETVKVQAIDATGHAVNITDADVEITPNFETKTAAVKITCPVEKTVVFEGSVTLTEDPANPGTYNYTATLADGSIYSGKVSNHTEHKWVFGGFVWSGLTSASASFTCENGGESKTAEVAMSSVTNGKDEKAVTRWTATVSKDPEGKAITPITDSKYVFADGTEATKADFDKAAGGEEGKTPSEPEESNVASYKSYNVFLTDTVISVPGLSEALGEATALSGKAANYYELAGDDAVKLKSGLSAANAKKAVSATNSLITVQTADGIFTYQLPVYYQKPALKLTSTKGTVNISKKDESGAVIAQILKTTVTEKKSTKAYEPLNLDGATLDYTIKGSNSVKPLEVAAGDNTGEIAITANAKSSGSITIKLDNWSEPVAVTYKIATAGKNVLTGSAKTIYMNVNAATGDSVQAAQEFELFINGNSEITEDDPVSVIYPKNWNKAGLTIDGVGEDGKLTDTKVSISFTEGATHNNGNYTVKFQTGSGKTKAVYSLKISVNNKALAGAAVTLKTQAKLDLTTGQRMVLIPQLKGISGEVTFEGIDEASQKNFEAEYNDDLGQLYLSPAEGANLSIKTKYTVTASFTVGGVPVTATVKNFKPVAKAPTVKIPAVSLKKADLGTKALNAETNILATYKVNGKTFSIEPTGVIFPNGTAVSEVPEGVEGVDTDGWFLDSVTKSYVKYDAETGKISVVAPAGAKKGTVKVNVTFKGGKTLKKSFKINAVK